MEENGIFKGFFVENLSKKAHMGLKWVIMVHNSYQHITNGVIILFEPKKGQLPAKKDILKQKKD